MPSRTPRRWLRVVSLVAAGGLLLQAGVTWGSPAPAGSRMGAVSSATRPQPGPIGASGSSPVARPDVARTDVGPAHVDVIPEPLPRKVVVTIQVIDETFKVLAQGEANVANAYALLEGTSSANIPVGTVVYGDPGINRPWSWHIDPATLTWAEVTVEVCDGRPSDVEAHAITSDDYCPWAAEVIAVRPLLPDSSTGRADGSEP